MNAILPLAAVAVCAVLWGSYPAQAGPYHDLVIGPVVSADQPFFQDGVFMLGDEKISIEQGSLPENKLVDYDPSAHKIVVNNDKTISEADKGAAVLQLMDAMAIQTIEPAAGQ